MGRVLEHRGMIILAVIGLVAAPGGATAQGGGTGSIRVQPNLATQSREGFTVCAGNIQNRAQYGSKVTGSTGIVTFTGIPAGTLVVTTVTKSGFGGREQSWIVPAAGLTSEAIITVFTGSGGPACSAVIAIGGAAPPPPPATSSVGIIVDPGSAVGRGGFYVCVGTAQNRAQYGNAVSTPSGPVNFVNLPGTAMIKATVVRAGYTGVERDWYPTPGQSVVLSMPITPGSGGFFTCPGYAAPYAKEIRTAVARTDQGAEVGFPAPILPAARVFDQYNNAMGGVPVLFGVIEGGGAVAPASVATDSDGFARVNSWTLGPNAGVNRVSAKVSGISTSVVFSANGVLVPAALEPVSAVSQQGVTRHPAPQPPAVVVRDRNGNPIGGVSVAFTASAGGSVGPARVVTGSDGIARVTVWTLAGIVGTNTVLASAGSLRATFTATGLAPAGILITNPMADLDVRLTQSSNPIVAGTQQTYTVKVHNRGAATASAVALRNTLPADLVFSSVRADRGFVCSRSGSSVNCVSGSVAVGDSATIRLVMSLAATAQSGHDIVFGAKVDPDNSIAESNEANNQAAAASTTQAAVAAPARLLEEALGFHGDPLNPGVKYSCKSFGSNYVLAGLKVNHRVTELSGIDLFCAPLRADGTLGLPVFVPGSATPGDTQVQAVCPKGQAIVAVQGTDSQSGIRSLQVHCSTILPTGLANGGTPTRITPALGIVSGDAWKPDRCTQNRPATAVKVNFYTFVDLGVGGRRMWNFQMFCEQPVGGS